MSEQTLQEVTKAAEALAQSLKAKRFGPGLKVEVGRAWNTNTGGSAIQVASLGRNYPVIEIWYDSWLDSDNYNYWVGFISKKVNIVEALYSKFIDTKKRERAVDYVKYDHHKYARVEGIYIDSYIEDSKCLSWFGVFAPSFSAYHVDRFSDFIELVLDTLPEFCSKIYREGACNQVTTNRYERNSQARDDCVERFGYSCQVCDMNFSKNYGDLGNDFIHVHHSEELSKTGERETTPANDLVPICPNCHAMLHRGDKLLTVDELRDIWKKRHSEDVNAAGRN